MSPQQGVLQQLSAQLLVVSRSLNKYLTISPLMPTNRMRLLCLRHLVRISRRDHMFSVYVEAQSNEKTNNAVVINEEAATKWPTAIATKISLERSLISSDLVDFCASLAYGTVNRRFGGIYSTLVMRRGVTASTTIDRMHSLIDIGDATPLSDRSLSPALDFCTSR